MQFPFAAEIYETAFSYRDDTGCIDGYGIFDFRAIMSLSNIIFVYFSIKQFIFSCVPHFKFPVLVQSAHFKSSNFVQIKHFKLSNFVQIKYFKLSNFVQINHFKLSGSVQLFKIKFAIFGIM